MHNCVRMLVSTLVVFSQLSVVLFQPVRERYCGVWASSPQLGCRQPLMGLWARHVLRGRSDRSAAILARNTQAHFGRSDSLPLRFRGLSILRGMPTVISGDGGGGGASGGGGGGGQNQKELDNHANQCNPNNERYAGYDRHFAGGDKERDNHANQMNPNNSSHGSSRGETNPSKK
mmetsp:Transcript_114122/g.362827  ORF Transcript_114122/g.362827 Transcript_114122/m.362827 type:complete len:175 (-) Transcript_114122:155-679(-)